MARYSVSRHVARPNLTSVSPGGRETDATHVEVSVFYAKGGMNYFTYKTEPRGYWLSVTPVKVGDGVVSFALFSGKKFFVAETSAVNKKRFDGIANAILSNAEKIADLWVANDMGGIDAIAKSVH